jgi:hypothetical protein
MCFYAGSTTYQPGDTLGNTTITLYQRTWTPDLIQDAIDKNGSLKDAFDMDPTVGRDVIFQAALRTHIRLDPFPGPVSTCWTQYDVKFRQIGVQKWSKSSLLFS